MRVKDNKKTAKLNVSVNVSRVQEQQQGKEALIGKAPGRRETPVVRRSFLQRNIDAARPSRNKSSATVLG